MFAGWNPISFSGRVNLEDVCLQAEYWLLPSERKKYIYIYIFITYSSLFNSPLGCHQTHYSWADVGCDGSEKHPMQGQVWDIRARSDYEGARPGLDCLTHHLILLSPNQHVMIMDGLIKDIFLNYENGSDSRLFNAASKQTLGADT